jgi:hypothetical protein
MDEIKTAVKHQKSTRQTAKNHEIAQQLVR